MLTFLTRLCSDASLVQVWRWQQTNELTISSALTNSSMPSTQWRAYNLFFEPSISSCSRPESEDDLFPSLDIYSFNPEDDIGTTVELFRVFIDRVPIDALTTKTLVRDYTFDYGTEGWYPGGARGFFDIPMAYTVPGGLALQATNNTNCFGFWTSPADIETSTAEELYQVTFWLMTDVEDRTKTPSFRLRLNSTDFAWCVAEVIDSQLDGEMSPYNDPAHPERRFEYNLYFYKPPTAEPLHLFVSLDLLNFNPDDVPTGTIYLDRCRVQTLHLPSFPEDNYF